MGGIYTQNVSLKLGENLSPGVEEERECMYTRRYTHKYGSESIPVYGEIDID